MFSTRFRNCLAATMFLTLVAASTHLLRAADAEGGDKKVAKADSGSEAAKGDAKSSDKKDGKSDSKKGHKGKGHHHHGKGHHKHGKGHHGHKHGHHGHGGKGHGHGGRGFPSAKEIFNRIDKDNDDSLSLDEFTKAVERFQKMRRRFGSGWSHGWHGRRGFHRASYRFHRRGGHGGSHSRHHGHHGGHGHRKGNNERFEKLERQIQKLQESIEKLSKDQSK